MADAVSTVSSGLDSGRELIAIGLQQRSDMT